MYGEAAIMTSFLFWTLMCFEEWIRICCLYHTKKNVFWNQEAAAVVSCDGNKIVIWKKKYGFKIVIWKRIVKTFCCGLVIVYVMPCGLGGRGLVGVFLCVSLAFGLSFTVGLFIWSGCWFLCFNFLIVTVKEMIELLLFFSIRWFKLELIQKNWEQVISFASCLITTREHFLLWLRISMFC